MGKIKSAIITAIVVLAVAVLFLFGVVSCRLPGGVYRYNSILSNIHLGSDLTGEAYTTLLPEGVITAEEYQLNVYEDDAEEGENSGSAETEEEESYADSYVACGAYYIELDVLDDYAEDGSADTDEEIAAAIEAFKSDVSADAEILSARFGNRRYTSYSVSVVDGVAIRVAVPSNFTYASYSGRDQETLSSDLTTISTTIYYLTTGGELTLRNTDSSCGFKDWVYSSQKADDSTSTVTYNILNVKANIADLFESVTYYAAGGTYAIRINLTSEGCTAIETASEKVANSDDTYIRFYVGEQNIINLTCESAIDSSSFYIEVDDEATARDYVALLNSVATGNALTFTYDYDDVLYGTAATGANTALLLSIAVLVILVALMAFAIARYKLLGLVFSLMTLGFADIMVAVMFLTGLQLTTVGVFVALMCLALFAGCNFWAYEAVRRENQVGRTMQASVKVGYRKTLSGVLELHIVLLVVSIMLALICSGEAAVCGLILLIGTLTSYVLCWFTRFMWYVTMSPVRDKYKFCGFKREALEDDD